MPKGNPHAIEVGTLVEKYWKPPFTGYVVAEFFMRSGPLRFVVEEDGGKLHILGLKSIRRVDPDGKAAKEYR